MVLNASLNFFGSHNLQCWSKWMKLVSWQQSQLPFSWEETSVIPGERILGVQLASGRSPHSESPSRGGQPGRPPAETPHHDWVSVPVLSTPFWIMFIDYLPNGQSPKSPPRRVMLTEQTSQSWFIGWLLQWFHLVVVVDWWFSRPPGVWYATFP